VPCKVLRLRWSCAPRSAVAAAAMYLARFCDSGGLGRCVALWLRRSCAPRSAEAPLWLGALGCATGEPRARFASLEFFQTWYVLPCGIMFRGASWHQRETFCRMITWSPIAPPPRSYKGLGRCKALRLRWAPALRGAEAPLWLGAHGHATGEPRARFASLGFASP
jgi:hypothetical protein